MREANRKLIKIVKLIENNHGRDKITPNLHLSLHLSECSFDYGPLFTFWYFSFERMNGMLGISVLYFFIGFYHIRLLICSNSHSLGSLLNSHQYIESELMRRMMFDAQIMVKGSEIETKGIELLETRPNV